MSRWNEIERDAPELAQRIQRCFETGINKTIATLRQDGAPRISAIELNFTTGNVTFGMMGGSLKLRDVRRDPRVAIHSPTIKPSESTELLGDAKLAGQAVEVEPPGEDAEPGSGYFVLDITEAAVTYLGDPADHLVVESWATGRGARRVQRY
ncbi:pyridoxamine 5'-phosphate oxidase family protein [Amycolatopsis nigrescens]|uniref:pyridoxamine 5'-phosphate oxidase family protein n=1 Tax=Amycolatopsis nigrescens TaxID=381445 RepID=UPI000373E2E9|nr:pyridoxamine 5'-phosphate oxidase family protein [Amycolatopsis nigrescens]